MRTPRTTKKTNKELLSEAVGRKRDIIAKNHNTIIQISRTCSRAKWENLVRSGKRGQRKTEKQDT